MRRRYRRKRISPLFERRDAKKIFLFGCASVRSRGVRRSGDDSLMGDLISRVFASARHPA